MTAIYIYLLGVLHAIFPWFVASPSASLNPKYTYVPDLPDFRDYAYADYGPRVVTAPIEASLENSPYISPVKDQSTLGSCTANAGTSIVEFIRRKLGKVGNLLSRLMWYRGERSYEHTVSTDSGAQIRDGIKFAFNTGVCFESLWPYIISKFRLKPPTACYTQGALNKITKYVRLGMDSASGTKGDLKADIINCLASGLPFTFGFTVYASFESDAVAKSGMVPMPTKGEKVLGGHAVYAIGYRTINGVVYILVRNSWGTGWGIKGDFLIPLEYLLNSDLAEDFWCVLS